MNINRNNYESWFLDYHEGCLSPEQVALLILFLEENADLKEEFESFEQLTIGAEFSSPVFSHKESLLKDILSEEDLRTWMIDILEENRHDRDDLEKNIKDKPTLLAEWELYQKTILEPEVFSFEAKSLLKRKEGVPVNYISLLIADVEGDLRDEEKKLLDQILIQYPELKHEQELFGATKLSVEKVVFEAKSSLKKSEKVIAFNFNYAVRIAAMLLIVLGAMFSINKWRKPELQIAEKPSVISPKSIVIQEAYQNNKKDSVINETPQQQKVNPPSLIVSGDKKIKRFKIKNNSGNTILPSENSSRTIETIAYMPFLSAQIQQDEPFVYVHRRPFFGNLNVQESEPILALNVEEIINDFVKQTNNKVEEIIENTPLDSKTDSGTKIRLPGRIIRSVAWAINKASDNRIYIKTTYNPITGHLAACEVKTANRKWQKQF
jgi:hypothetical protein